MVQSLIKRYLWLCLREKSHLQPKYWQQYFDIGGQYRHALKARNVWSSFSDIMVKVTPHVKTELDWNLTKNLKHRFELRRFNWLNLEWDLATVWLFWHLLWFEQLKWFNLDTNWLNSIINKYIYRERESRVSPQCP